MKRNLSQDESPGLRVYVDHEDGGDDVDEALRNHADRLISPGKINSPRPSKVRRQGEKIMSALRSLTTSGKSPLSSSSPGKSSIVLLYQYEETSY